MSAAFETFRNGLFDHMANTGADPKDVMSVQRIFVATHNFLTENNFTTSDSAPGTESLRTIPKLVHTGQESYANIQVDALDAFLTSCNVPDDVRPSCAIEVARILSGACSDASYFIEDGRQNKKTMPMNQIYDSNTIAMLNLDRAKALESFGEYSDRVTSDSRLSVALTILRAHKSLIDRVLPRKAAEDPVVIIKIPNAEVYNLDLSQNPVASLRVPANRQPLIELYRDPNAVDTTPQQIVVQKANDVAVPAQLQANGIIYAGQKVNLFDLTLSSSTPGYQAVDWTDLVADGGAVGSVVIQVTSTPSGGGAATIEQYTVSTQYLRQAQFTTQTNVQDSGDRAANIRSKFAFTAGATVSGGTSSAGTALVPGATSTLLAPFTGVNLVVELTFNANLNIKNGYTDGNGTIAASLQTALTSVPTSVQTDFGLMTFQVVAWSPYLFFSEENMRKTSSAVRMLYKEIEFLIPPGRNFVVDYSLMGQEIGSDVTNAVSEVINIGNSWRSVNIINNTLTAVYNRLQFELANPEIDYYSSVASDYAAGTLSLPHVMNYTLNVSLAAVMREAERLSDLHSYVTSRILALIADGHNKSMYTENFEPGERARYKVITSGPIAEVLFGITQYWNTLDDKVAVAENSSYSLKLPNGTQLDIIKSNFEFFANTMLIIPVRDAKPDDVTSFGTILDRGTFVGQYNPVANGSANKRIVANSREILFPTNPLGYIITVTGLQSELSVLTDGPGLME